MIAFNFNIHFQDEPSLDDGLYDKTKEKIHIVKSSDSAIFENLHHKSDYLPLSGRMACYGAQRVFSNCEEGCLWGVDVKELVSFVWSCGDRTLYYLPKPSLTAELLQFWTLHTIIPMMLDLDETYHILHVGAVEVEGEAIIFSADSFGGKSTLTDYFIKQGHTLFSDDTLGVYEVDGIVKAVASYPFHRPFREPESLGYSVSNVSRDPRTIRALFLLEKSDEKAEVSLTEVKGIEKYRAFHFSTFINFDFMKAKRFKALSMMANSITVYKVTVPWDIKRLGEVYEKIVKTIEPSENI